MALEAAAFEMLSGMMIPLSVVVETRDLTSPKPFLCWVSLRSNQPTLYLCR